MSSPVNRVDWDALRGVLNIGIDLLKDKNFEAIKQCILQFAGTAYMLGFSEVSETGRRFESFLVKSVSPNWDDEAVATLRLAMATLAEKMQAYEYGPEFNAALAEVHLLLDLCSEEDPAVEKPLSVEPKARAQGTGYTIDTIDMYARMIEEDPTSTVFCKLAEEYCKKGLWDEVVKTCRNGLACHPYHLRGKVALGEALWHLGEDAEARRVLEEARVELEQSAQLYRILAEIAGASGDESLFRRLMGIFDGINQGLHTNDSMPIEPQMAPPVEEFLPPEPEISQEASFTALDESLPQPPKAPPLVEFLSSLLEVFESRDSAVRGSTGLFSESDRKSLRVLLVAAA